MAVVRFFPRNTARKMLPTLSQFKTYHSPSPPSFCSFSLVPSLWCATPLRLECQSTTITGLNILKCARRCTTRSLPDFSELLPRSRPHNDQNVNPGLDDSFTIPRGKRKRGQDANEDGEPDIKRRKQADDLRVGLEIKEDGGEYVMKIKNMTASEGKDEVERAKLMAQNAAKFLHHAKMLWDIGQKLLAQSRARLPSRRIRKSDS